jgi:chlorite dismutase
MAQAVFSFVGGTTGRWQITHMAAVIGAPLEAVSRLDILNVALASLPNGAAWMLRGETDDAQYMHPVERAALAALQPPLDRAEATCAALIPIKKATRWWALTQHERRTIFEEQAHHMEIGMQYLPAVARRLHYCRDLNTPFDFLTWFEYAPEHADAFEVLTSRLRATEEWGYMEREIDIRLTRL